MDNPDEMSIEKAIRSSLRSDRALNIAADAVELGLDAIQSQGVIREIPIVNTLVSIGKIGLSIRDAIFTAKLLRFLNALRDVPANERRAMLDKLEGDRNFGRKAGHHLLELLERNESHRKPEMTARVFAAYVSGKVDLITFHRLNTAIERLPSYEIDGVRQALRDHEKGQAIEASELTLQAYQAAGLATAAAAWGGLVYTPTDLCRVFVELDLDFVGK